jgi:hypothetical protein
MRVTSMGQAAKSTGNWKKERNQIRERTQITIVELQAYEQAETKN